MRHSRVLVAAVVGEQHDPLGRGGWAFGVIQRRVCRVERSPGVPPAAGVVVGVAGHADPSAMGNRVPPPVKPCRRGLQEVRVVVTTIETGRPLC